jgi:predicted RNA-binding protein YlxR (DUF448 family)
MINTGDTVPIRTCVGCRAKQAQGRLLRYARRADGYVVPANVTRELSGRSAYLCPRRACLDQAAKRRAFARAFSTDRRRLSVMDVDTNALWAATAEQLRREIDLLARTSESSRRPAADFPHSHHRRRGLEQLLSELSSPPQAPERSASKRAPTKQPDANVTPATDAPGEGGAPNHG